MTRPEELQRTATLEIEDWKREQKKKFEQELEAWKEREKQKFSERLSKEESERRQAFLKISHHYIFSVTR